MGLSMAISLRSYGQYCCYFAMMRGEIDAVAARPAPWVAS